MIAKNKFARITIDLPLDLQKRLKAIAAVNRISMRAVVIKSIEQRLNKMKKESDSALLKQIL